MSRIYPHIEEYEIGREGYTFQCTIYVKPSELTEYFKKQIVDHLGDRKVRGEICLGTTKDVVREGLAGGIYDGVIVVKNKSLPAGQHDIATGCLQYMDHCGKGRPQFWITDVCRQLKAEPKPTVSPTKILMGVYKDIARSIHVPEIHLAVDQEDEKGHEVLSKHIYPDYGYTVDPDCDYPGHTIMKKTVLRKSKHRSSLSRMLTRSKKNSKSGRKSIKSKSIIPSSDI